MAIRHSAVLPIWIVTDAEMAQNGGWADLRQGDIEPYYLMNFQAFAQEINTVISNDTVDQEDFDALQSDVGTLQTGLTTVQGSITTIQGNITTLQNSVTTIQSNIGTTQSDLSTHISDTSCHGVNIAIGKTLTLNNSITLSATSDNFTLTANGSGTIALVNAANNFGGNQTITNGNPNQAACVMVCASGQAVDICEWQDNNGNIVACVSPNGMLETTSGLDIEKTSTNNAVATAILIKNNANGNAQSGFGVSIDLKLESSTTDDQDAARISALWNTSTHASRKADLVFEVADSGGWREGMRVRGSGSACQIGFFGATPASKPTITGGLLGNVVLGNLITALANLGLVNNGTS